MTFCSSFTDRAGDALSVPVLLTEPVMLRCLGPHLTRFKVHSQKNFIKESIKWWEEE